MKKLLKSILIATASVGAIAGSTAAVVSCGTKTTTNDTPNDEGKAEQEKYNQALTDLKTILYNRDSLGSFTMSKGATNVALLKSELESKISDLIKNYENLRDALETPEVTIPNGAVNTDTAGLNRVSNILIVKLYSIYPSIDAKTITFKINYDVLVTNQDNYNSTIGAIQTYFKTNDIFKATSKGFNRSFIPALVQSSIWTLIQSNSLTPTQKESINVSSKEMIKVSITGTFDSSIGTHKTTESTYITISIPANVGATSSEVNLIEAQYDMTGADVQENYNSVIDALKLNFKTNDIFNIEAKEFDPSLIPGLVQNSIWEFIQGNTLTDYQKASISVTSKEMINVTITGTLDSSTGTHKTTESSYFIITIPAATGAVADDAQFNDAQYTLTGSTNQDIYNTQSDDFAKAFKESVSSFKFSLGDTKEAIQEMVMNAVNKYLSDNASTYDYLKQITDSKTITFDDINTLTPGERTSSMTFTMPPIDKAVKIVAKAETQVFNYSIELSQDDYNSAFNKIFTYFKTNSIFELQSAHVTLPLMQEQIANNIKLFVESDALTLSEKATIDLSDLSKITVDKDGSLPNSSGVHHVPYWVTLAIYLPAAGTLKGLTTDKSWELQYAID